jgi:hypothetical protein
MPDRDARRSRFSRDEKPNETALLLLLAVIALFA